MPICVTDPFNLDHNLGAGVTRKMASYIQTAFIKGRERFGFPRYDIPAAFCQRYFFDVYYLTDGYEAPADRNCRVCGKIGHIAKDCPHSKSNRRAEQKKEEEQRIANQEGEKPDLSRKPFNAGSSRPRSTSAPNKQAQSKGVDNRTSTPVAKPTEIPSRQVANVASLSGSQPEVHSSPVKEEQNNTRREDNPVKVCGMSGVSHTLPNGTQEHSTIPDVPSPNIMNETGELSRSSNNGNQSNVAASTTVQTSSDVPLGHEKRASSLPINPQSVKPPPGFYIAGGTSHLPHASTPGLPHTMSGGILASPPGSISQADIFEGQSIILNTPPRHQAGVFSPQSGHFVGSPTQHEMWLRQQGMMMLGHLSPPLRPLVPYPLTPELQAHTQLHQWRVASDSLPMQQHVGSPFPGQEPHAELSHQILAQSPPNVSRNVMWPVGRNSPPSAARGPHFQGHQLQSPHVSSPGMPVPTIGSPQSMAHPLLSQGNFPSIRAANLGSPQRLSHGNSHAAPGTPQQMLQQRLLAHPSGMSPLVLGSPPQHTSQQPAPHQQGLVEPGTHMVSSPYWPYWFYY